MDHPVEVEAINSKNFVDRLWLCWGHLDNWRKQPIVQKSKEWLNKTNVVFTPTTLIAYKNRLPVGMIEFMPQSQLSQFGLCPCRIDADNQETENRYILGKEFDNYLFISCLFVAKDHQGKGVGKTLVNNLLYSEFFGKYNGALVYVRERDQNWEKFIQWPAGPKEFYLKAGFSTLKTLEKPTGYILCYKR